MHPAALLLPALLAAPPGGEAPLIAASNRDAPVSPAPDDKAPVPPNRESPASPASDAEATAPSDPTRPSTLVVRARGLDEVALQQALRPRSGGADVVLLRDVAAVDRDHVLVDVELREPDLTITVLLRDGRVFVRRAPAPAGPRDAARQVASMLAAIAGDALAPLPADEATPVLAGLAEHVPADMLTRSADVPLGVPVPPESTSAAAPAKPATPPPTVRTSPAKPAPKDSSLSFDLALAGAPILGLGVPDAGLRGGGGDIRLELRGARPWLVALAVRAAGHRASAPAPTGDPDRFGLARVRVSLGAGTWLRRGRLDLHLSGGLSLEPWLLRHEGRRARPDEGASAPAPLLGGFLRLAPALVVAAPIRIGVFAELAASATARGRAVQIDTRRGDQPSRLFTLGGLEASLGVELRIALASPRRDLAKR